MRALLAFNDFISKFPSPINRANFNIRNTRNNLNALKATKLCALNANNVKYFGMVEKKSINP